MFDICSNFSSVSVACIMALHVWQYIYRMCLVNTNSCSESPFNVTKYFTTPVPTVVARDDKMQNQNRQWSTFMLSTTGLSSRLDYFKADISLFHGSWIIVDCSVTFIYSIGSDHNVLSHKSRPSKSAINDSTLLYCVAKRTFFLYVCFSLQLYTEVIIFQYII